MSKESKTHIDLRLGDIIEIIAPSNVKINQQTYFIYYIDTEKIRLTNISTQEPLTLTMYEDGRFTEESITHIVLLSRADEEGFARQNGLTTGKWVSIYFGGDFPSVITGEITNLDEDMIELMLYPSFATIFIDFAYKGLPENIPILNITFQEKPEILRRYASIQDYIEHREDETEGKEEHVSSETTPEGENILKIPENPKVDKPIKKRLEEEFIDIADIKYGEEIDVEIEEEVGKFEQRHGIEHQLTNLFDELLATIPTVERNSLVIETAQKMVQRFKELREKCSRFDETGNVIGYNNFNAAYKPLVDKMDTLAEQVRWIMPVIKERTRIYKTEESEGKKKRGKSQEESEEAAEEHEHFINIDQQELMNEMESFMKLYADRNTEKRYSFLYRNLSNSLIGYEPPIIQSDILAKRSANSVPIDTIISNTGDFESFHISGKSKTPATSQFKMQRHLPGYTHKIPKVLRSGKTEFETAKMTEADPLYIKSIIMFPEPVVEFSRVDLPGTSIMDKTHLSNHWFMPSFFFAEKPYRNSILINNSEPVDYDQSADRFLKYMRDFNVVMPSVGMDETEVDPASKKYREFLDQVIPRSRDIFTYMKDRLTKSQYYNFSDIIGVLEPFGMNIDNITYSAYIAGEKRKLFGDDKEMAEMMAKGGLYQEIRHFIREQIKNYKMNYAAKMAEYHTLLSKNYGLKPKANNFYRLFAEDREKLKMIVENYGLLQGIDQDNNIPQSSSSIWNHMLLADYGRTYFQLLKLLNYSLYTPELDKFGLPESLPVDEKVKVDCYKKTLAKKYTSEKDLADDNANPDVYFDPEFDDTPYDLLKPYKAEQRKLSERDFYDYLKTNLTVKHGANPNIVDNLASTLIRGKRRVEDGQYAMLVLYPRLPSKLSQFMENKDKREQLEAEANARKKIRYYRRIGNYWKEDQEIEHEHEFLNSGEFCNTSPDCIFANATTNSYGVCEPVDVARDRMKQLAKKQLNREMETRYILSIDDYKNNVEDLVVKSLEQLRRDRRYREARLVRANRNAFNIGKLYLENETVIQSPYTKLLGRILGQTDFIRQQENILRFRNRFCRTFVHSESPHWFYCIETGVPLLPAFYYRLANAFVVGGNYEEELSRVKKEIGKISEDGYVVDVHTGHFICKIDDSIEEGYDNAGFKIKTREILEQDLDDKIEQALKDEIIENQGNLLLKSKKTAAGKKVFENTDTQMIYNIYMAICGFIDVDGEALEGRILSVMTTLIRSLYTREKYKKIEEKKAKENKEIASYDTYRQQNIIIYTIGVLFLAIQTQMPSITVKRVFPGCVFSFSGYPFGGIEDQTGLTYMSCVVEHIKSAVEPWNSIRHLKHDGILKRILEIIPKILEIEDCNDWIRKKKEYLILYPENVVPLEHGISRWTTFQPPIIPFTVEKSTTGVSSELKDEIAQSMKTGHKSQHGHIAVVDGKMTKHSYAIVESINRIVAKIGADALLKAGTIMFLENACCETMSVGKSIDYFAEKDPAIHKYIDFGKHHGRVLSDIKQLTVAPYLYCKFKQMVSAIGETDQINEETIYQAFIHYCRLDQENQTVPDDLLVFYPSKLAGLKKTDSLADKIQFMKTHGKKHGMEDFDRLMAIVRRRTMVDIPASRSVSFTHGFQDLLTYLSRDEQTDSPIVEPKLVDLTNRVLEQYTLDKAVVDSVYNENANVRALKTHLRAVNKNMIRDLLRFFEVQGATQKEYDLLTEHFVNLTEWETEIGPHRILQWIQNSMYQILRLYPAIFRGHSSTSFQNLYKTEREHWDFADAHYRQLEKMFDKNYAKLGGFFNNQLLNQFFISMNPRMADLISFLDFMPKMYEFAYGESKFYTVFDNTLILLFGKYLYVSMFYEWITNIDKPEFQEINMREKKKRATERINEEKENANEYDETEDYVDSMNEIMIDVNDNTTMKEHLYEYMKTVIQFDIEHKKEMNLSYQILSERVYISKQEEKKTITDYFKNITDNDELKLAKLYKKYKMGRWNIGEQKGVYKYDKAFYESERQDIDELLRKQRGEGDDENPRPKNGIDVDELDESIRLEQEREEEQEMYGIGELDDDYMDGVVYEEDRDDEFRED